MTTDVVIAGAGPNGLMLACELSLAGIRPVVLEPLPGPNPEPRANGLVGQVVRLLDRRGLYERLAETSEPPRPAPNYIFGAFPLDLRRIADNPVYVLPVPQVKIVAVLAERAAELGVDIRWGHPLARFHQSGECVTVDVDGPDGPYQLDARYLVGADGGHSPTRKLAGIDFPGETTDRTVSRTANATPPREWVDHATGALDVPGFGRVPPTRHFRTEHGIFVWAPFPGRELVTTMEWDAPADDGPMTLQELQESTARVLGVEVPLQPLPADRPQLRRRTVGGNSRLAATYREGRVLLVGDAAHVHSAIGGPGLNLGLQDAVNLGWKLAGVLSGWADPALLDTYDAERRPVSERVLMQTRAQSALIAPGAEVTALRELFAELLADPDTVEHIADLITGADVRYPAEPDAHPLVGRWAPDLTIETAAGVRRLAELTRDARPLLLDLTGGTLAAALTGLPDRMSVVAGRATDTAPATALLLRPDGYVAWASSAEQPDPPALVDAAQRWFGASAVACV